MARTSTGSTAPHCGALTGLVRAESTDAFRQSPRGCHEYHWKGTSQSAARPVTATCARVLTRAGGTARHAKKRRRFQETAPHR